MISNDWITAKQEHHTDIPPMSEWNLPEGVDPCAYEKFSVVTGEKKSSGTSPVRLPGSFSTMITVSLRGTEVHIDGNVSRYNRIDNYVGLPTLDATVKQANQILKDLHPDIPPFTKATNTWYSQDPSQKHPVMQSNGMKISRIDLCSNQAVGQGNVDDYLRSLSMLHYRNMRPHLHDNHKTVDWQKPNQTSNVSTHLYAKCYDKAFELSIHALPKIKRKFGDNSPEHNYLLQLIDNLKIQGIARSELSFKRRFLAKHGCTHYGLFDESQLKDTLKQFIDIDKNAGGNAMSYETLLERLISSGACKSQRSASTTLSHYDSWRAGRPFTGKQRSYETHRAALRKVGIDIAIPYDQSKVVDLFVKETREIIRRPATVPDFYKHHPAMELRAV